MQQASFTTRQRPSFVGRGWHKTEEPVSAPKPPSDHLRHGNSMESQSATGSAVVDKRTTWPGLDMDFPARG